MRFDVLHTFIRFVLLFLVNMITFKFSGFAFIPKQLSLIFPSLDHRITDKLITLLRPLLLVGMH